FLEPTSGASGDMTVGALLDLGVPFERIQETLKLLPLDGYTLSAKKCVRSGIEATKFDVQTGPSHHHRRFEDIRRMIESSGLSDWVREKSIETFRLLAEAEGKVHGRPPEKIHFHEVGAVDSIVDIVGTMIAMEPFRTAKKVCTPINVGHGTLECRHGIYPVPAPAVQELLKGVPVFSNRVGGELTTPTGAVLLVALVDEFGKMPAMKIRATGYGAGTQQTPGNANVLRISLGEALDEDAVSSEKQVAVVVAAVDDMNPQVYGYVQEKAFAAGALDVYTAPIHMKKNRPGQEITCVCRVQDVERLAGLLFAETTTIGVRYTIACRKTLQREFQRVATPYGEVTVKLSFLDGRLMNVAPEFEDCRRLAETKNVPLKEIQAAAACSFERSRRQDI
ncbi:MAG TPA: nickel pincer cofactor biosynthesis protein LarC, partial [Acidobacteriota bacterium]|nr:nickel pincer cofactor biosynthesis protein LarC [Acidobacteriota bacterium]